MVGWDSQADGAMPYNFSRRQKWTWVWSLSVITLLTPLATSILSPSINLVDKDFDNHSDWLGSMTVTIFLFGYVVGPIFIAPLSEIYGRKWVLTGSCTLFCVWQIGCGMAPNIETLIVSRFFSGVGGAAPLVSCPSCSFSFRESRLNFESRLSAQVSSEISSVLTSAALPWGCSIWGPC
nr:efflux pump rdc3 [Quercus suber]